MDPAVFSVCSVVPGSDGHSLGAPGMSTVLPIDGLLALEGGMRLSRDGCSFERYCPLVSYPIDAMEMTITTRR